MLGYGVLFFVGLAVGFGALVGYEGWMDRRAGRTQPRSVHGPA